MSTTTIEKTATKTCTVEDCERGHYARGWCRTHYQRWQRHGDPLGTKTNRAPRGLSPVKRLAWLTEPDAEHPECWAWMSTRDRNGYGKVQVGGRSGQKVMAHRWSYELLVGPIPDGHEIDHICEFPSCVNPKHLQALTPEDHRRITRERREAREAMGLDAE